MRALINGLFLQGNYIGIHHTTKHLFNAINNLTPDVDLLIYEAEQLTSANYVRSHSNLLRSRVGRILFENLNVSSLVKRGGYQLFHSMNYVLPLSTRKFKTVLTIHDTISLDYPQCCKRSSVAYHGMLMSRSAKQASKVIAVSHKVKEDILKHFSISDDKVEVIYHGIDPIFRQKASKIDLALVRKKYKLTSPYLLFVGTVEPKKNIGRLIDAFMLVKKKLDLPHKLILAGKNGWKSKALLKRISQLQEQGMVQKLNYVAQPDLPSLYQMADATAFPSLYEGFGIPALESLASGTPTLVSSMGAAAEITSGHSIMANPYSMEELVKGLEELMTSQSKRELLINGGLQHSQSFTWERAASQMLSIYQSV